MDLRSLFHLNHSRLYADSISFVLSQFSPAPQAHTHRYDCVGAPFASVP